MIKRMSLENRKRGSVASIFDNPSLEDKNQDRNSEMKKTQKLFR